MPDVKSRQKIIHDSYATALGAGTSYYELPTRDGTLGLFIAWPDATSNAAITLETTNDMKAAADAAASDKWFPEAGVSITGPTAAAAGCSMKHLGNMGAARARLKVVRAANTKLKIIANYNEA